MNVSLLLMHQISNKILKNRFTENTISTYSSKERKKTYIVPIPKNQKSMPKSVFK